MSSVLLVEDDAALIEMYKIVFSRDQLDLVMAADGEEALQKIKTLHPTIVLLDIMMPKMNGVQVLQAIKSDPNLQDIRVVMLTNLYNEEIELTVKKLGAENYVIKSQLLPQDIVKLTHDMLNSSPPQKT